jgi:large subunit ribosomal protein L10
MKKTEKALFVENLTQELKSAKSIIFVNYAGLSVSMQQDLKKRLKEVNSRMVVVKNTLLKLAGENAKLPKESLEDSVLTGQNALIIADDDPIAPLQVIYKFAKEFEVPQFRVGIVEGTFQEKEALEKLSTLPGKDGLLLQVLGSIAAPTYMLVGTLEGNLQQLIYILETKAKQG